MAIFFFFKSEGLDWNSNQKNQTSDNAWRCCFVFVLFQVQEESKWSDYAKERYNTSEAKNSYL